jgi:hypothetical protein
MQNVDTKLFKPHSWKATCSPSTYTNGFITEWLIIATDQIGVVTAFSTYNPIDSRSGDRNCFSHSWHYSTFKQTTGTLFHIRADSVTISACSYKFQTTGTLFHIRANSVTISTCPEKFQTTGTLFHIRANSVTISTCSEKFQTTGTLFHIRADSVTISTSEKFVGRPGEKIMHYG